MVQGAKLRSMIKRVIYNLKRGWGSPIIIVKTIAGDTDLRTGEKTLTRTDFTIKRAIVFPDKYHRSFSYDIGFLKANSNFTYGGFYVEGQRDLIIDRKDLPDDFVLTTTDQFYILFDGNKYQIKEVQSYDFKLAYYVTMIRIQGEPIASIREAKVVQTIAISSDSGGEV